MKLHIITSCLLLFKQYAFTYDYLHNIYTNDYKNTPNIISSIKSLNNNRISSNINNKCKFILINKKDIKKNNVFNKAVVYNSNTKLLIGKTYDKNINCYKLIVKKPNHRRIFEKLIVNNRKTQIQEEDIDVLARFRLEQIIKDFKNANNNEVNDNIKDWREEFWSDRKLPIIDSDISQSNSFKYNNTHIDSNNTILNCQEKNDTSLLNELNKNIQIKLDRLYKLHNELSKKYL